MILRIPALDSREPRALERTQFSCTLVHTLVEGALYFTLSALPTPEGMLS